MPPHFGEAIVGNIGTERAMDYTVIGDPVNTVFRLQNITKSFPNGIIISENTLQAARTRPDVGEIKISSDLDNELGGRKVFELLEQKPGKPYVVAAS